MKDSLGDKLNALRLALGVSVEDLAEHAGINISSIYHWEAGRRHPKDEHLCKVCNVLDKLCKERGIMGATLGDAFADVTQKHEAQILSLFDEILGAIGGDARSKKDVAN